MERNKYSGGRSCPNHIHVLLDIFLKMSISSFMEFMKGKSSLTIYEKIGEVEIQISKPRILV